MSLDVWLTVTHTDKDGNETVTDSVFDYNITHNLNTMAEEIGLYQALWRPEEIDIKYACELSPYLEQGLKDLIKHYNDLQKLNPENGWGDWDGLFEFVKKYAIACRKYPNSKIKTWR